MAFIIGIIVIIIDQLTKSMAIKYLKSTNGKVIIEDFFQFHYVENYGAAFGILQNKKIFFIIVTLTIVSLICVFLIRYSKNINVFLKIALGLLLGGAIGNFIDRIRLGYVVDFISVRLIRKYDFPVFNVADIAIVIATGILILIILFDEYEN